MKPEDLERMKADIAWLERQRYTGHGGEENAEIRARRDRDARIDRIISALQASEADNERLRGALIEMLALYDTALMATEFTKPRAGQIVMNIAKLKAAIEAARQALEPHHGS